MNRKLVENERKSSSTTSIPKYSKNENIYDSSDPFWWIVHLNPNHLMIHKSSSRVSTWFLYQDLNEKMEKHPFDADDDDDRPKQQSIVNITTSTHPLQYINGPSVSHIPDGNKNKEIIENIIRDDAATNKTAELQKKPLLIELTLVHRSLLLLLSSLCPI